jgi:hypothetical protein
MTPTEELKTLLKLAHTVANEGGVGTVIKLLNGWSKRTSEQDKQKSFSAISKREWDVGDGHFSSWLLDQKMLHPKDIHVDIPQLGEPYDWLDETDLSKSFQRIIYIVANCPDEQYVTEVIEHLEHDLVLKKNDTGKISAFERFLSDLTPYSLKFRSSCVVGLPDAVFKHISFSDGDKKQYEVQRSVLKMLGPDLDCKTFETKILPKLAQLDSCAVSLRLERHLKDVVSLMPFEQFANAQQYLQTHGWDTTHTNSWALRLDRKTLDGDSNGWMKHWAQHNRSSLLRLLAEKISDVLADYPANAHQKDFEKIHVYFKSAYEAGISKKELNSYVLKHNAIFKPSIISLMMECSLGPQTHLKKLFGNKKFAGILNQAKDVFPPAFYGTIAFPFYANGYLLEAPSQLISFKPLTLNQWQEECGVYNAKQVFATQQQYASLQQKSTIEKSIAKSMKSTKSLAPKRKI